MSKKPLTHLFSFCLALFFTGGALAQEGPQLLSIPEHGQYCTGEDGLPLQAADLETEVTYQLQARVNNDWIGLQTFTLSAGESEYGFEGDLFTEGEYSLFWLDEDDEGQLTGVVTIAEKPLPASFSLIDQSDDNCVPVQPGFNDSQAGVTYTLLRNGATLAEDASGGGAFDFGTFLQPGHYAARAGWTSGAQCLREMGGGFTSYPLPIEVGISPADAFCAGQDIQLTFHGTEANTTYYIMLDGQEELFFPSDAGGDVVLNPSFVQAGNYQVEAVNAHQCLLVFEREIVIGPSPQQFSMPNPGDQCPGTEIALSACEEGVIYRLPPPLPLPGSKGGEEDVENQKRSSEYLECSDGTLSFGPKNQSGIYRIEGIHQESGCKTWMHGETRIHPQPQLFQLLPDLAEACLGEVSLQLSGSQANVEYTLYRNEEEEVETIPGDQAGGMVTFGPVTEEGSYRVRATKMDEPGCSRWMNGEIELYQPPTTYAMTANGEIPTHNTFCTSTAIEIGLNNAQAGVEYRLRRDGTNIATLTPGEPGPIQFEDVSLGSGLFTITAHRAGCSTLMNGSIKLSAGPARYGLSASSHEFCEGDENSITLTLSNTQAQVLYSLEKDGTMVSDPVPGPGGEPLHWHNVSQYGAGEYRVMATFPADEGCPVFTDPVTLSSLGIPDLTISLKEEAICKNSCTELQITYSGSKPMRLYYTDSFEVFSIEIDPAAGSLHSITICPTDDTIYWPMSMEYLVEPYCQFDISDMEPVLLSVMDNPAVYLFAGEEPPNAEGNHCGIVTPLLSGSQDGVHYSLVREGPPGGGSLQPPLNGDGEPLVFNPISLIGTYKLVGTNNENQCSTLMDGEIHLVSQPSLFQVTPSGDLCLNGSFSVGLELSQEATRYVLFRNGAPHDDTYIDSDGSGGISFDGLSQAGTYEIQARSLDTGCERMMEGSLVVHPTPQSFNLGPQSPSCPPIEPFLNGSQDGVQYTLLLDGETTGQQVTGDGTGPLHFDSVHQAGQYTALATNPFGCQTPMNGVAMVHPSPVELDISPSGLHCAGGNIVLTYHNTQSNTAYSIFDESHVLITSFTGDGSSMQVSQAFEPGIYHTVATSAQGCSISFSSEKDILVAASPKQFPMLNQLGCPGNEVILQGCEENVSYYLEFIPLQGKGDDEPETDSWRTAFQCEDGLVHFGTASQAGTYRVQAVHQNGCSTWMQSEMVVYPSPGLFQLTSAPEGCIENTQIGLSGSEPGVTYRLMLGEEIMGFETGTGDALEFPLQTQPGTYRVKAVSGNDCSRWMSGQTVLYDAPGSFQLTANGEVPAHQFFCSETLIGLSNSQQGVNYRLRRDGIEVANITSPEGGPLDFDPVSEQGSYSITAHRAGCSTPMEGSITIGSEPLVYNLSASETTFCQGDDNSIDLTLANSQAGVSYKLLRNGEELDISPKAGNGAPLSWENVSQFGAGQYHVEAVYPLDDSCPALTNSVSIEEVSLPFASMISSEGESFELCMDGCLDLIFTYEGSKAARITYASVEEEFMFYLDPAEGPLFTIEICPAESTVYSLTKIKFTEAPYCELVFANPDQVSIQVLPKPLTFILSGVAADPQGISCAPVTPLLNGSEEGVQYALFKSGSVEPVETLVGDGSPLEYGPLSAGGVYHVMATNADDCSKQMQGMVTVNALPTPRNLMPVGEICSHTSFTVALDGSPQADVIYTLWLDDGPYSDFHIIDGDLADEIIFEGLNLAGTYRIHAERKTTGCQRMMPGSLTARPAPQAFKLKPEEASCSPLPIYLSNSETGVSYTLWRTGATEDHHVQTVTGTASVLYFTPVAEAGNYFVIATNEETCQRTMNGTVTVWGLPEKFDITPGPGQYCVSDTLYVGLDSSSVNKTYHLFRDGQEIPDMNMPGNGSAIQFPEPATMKGEYKVKAINDLTGCESWMTGSIFVNQLPYQYQMTSGMDTPDLCLPLELGLENSQTGIEYFLVHPNGSDSLVTGTGEAISFGVAYMPGTYTVYARNPNTGCTAEMIGEKLLVQGPRYLPVSLLDDNPYYCEDDPSGNSICLEETDEGVIYQLVLDGLPVDGTQVDGHGGTICWHDVGFFGAGHYEVVAISQGLDDEPDCMLFMEHGYDIIELALPSASFLGNDTIEACAADQAMLSVNYSGSLPMHLYYSIDGILQEPPLLIDPEQDSPPFHFSLPPLGESALVELVQINYLYGASAFCIRDIEENNQVTVIVSPIPSHGLPPQIELCGLGDVHLMPQPQNFTSFEWVLVSGGGIILNENSLEPTYRPVEADLGTMVELTLLLTGNDACEYFLLSIDVEIVFHVPPGLTAGMDKHRCTNDTDDIQLYGEISGGASSAVWTGGQGDFSPSFHSPEATYTPHPNELAAGMVELTLSSNNPPGPCQVVQDTMTIYFHDEVIVSAGNDIEMCTDEMFIQLNGQISGGTSEGTWSGFQGQISDVHDLNAIYYPHPDEIELGLASLVLTSDNPDGPCQEVSDVLSIQIFHKVQVDAGEDMYVCTSNFPVELNGQVWGGAETGVWSAYGGVISNPTDLNASYWPSEQEIANGQMNLVLTSVKPAGPCGVVSDSLTVNIFDEVFVDAGEDIIICTNELPVQLNGSIWGGTSQGVWSEYDGTISDPTNLHALYWPSTDEIAAGQVTLRLTSENPEGPCDEAFDMVNIIIFLEVMVDAGDDIHMCDSQGSVQLSGEIWGGTESGIWSAFGGQISDPGNLNATYWPSDAEFAAGVLTLVLTSENPSGPCGVVSDTLMLYFYEQVNVDAGEDIIICTNELPVQLNGSIWGGTSQGVWSGYDGTISEPTDLQALYWPSDDEIASGQMTMRLTSENPTGPCDGDFDTMDIFIYLEVMVDAGDDIHLCSSQDSVQLSGEIWGGTASGIWSAYGGQISDPGDLNATYWPSDAEFAAGVVSLVLTSENPSGPCGVVSDTMILHFYEEVIVNAGDDLFMCSSDLSIQLGGHISGGISTGYWSGYQGDISNPSDLSAWYWPSQDEISVGWVDLVLSSDNPAGPCMPVTDQMRIHIDPAAVVNAGSNHVILSGDSVYVDDAQAYLYENLEWIISPIALGSFENALFIDPIYHSVEMDAGNTLFLTLNVNGLGQCNDSIYSDQAYIKIGGPVIADFEALEDRPQIMLCTGETAYFEDQSHIPSPHDDQLITRRLWDFDDGSPLYVSTNPNETLFEHVYDQHGHYNVKLVVETGIDGIHIHSDTLVQQVHIRDCSSPNLFVPNALAPNDPNPEVRTFLPKGINLVEYKLKIYDKKGNLVWQTQELDEYDGSPKSAWEGTNMIGNPMPQGVYIYYIHARFRNGKVFGVSTNSNDKRYGTITLIR